MHERLSAFSVNRAPHSMIQAVCVFVQGVRMRKGLAHMVWLSCAVLNYTDGESGVNHSLTGDELFLLLYLAVSSALYVLPSV